MISIFCIGSLLLTCRSISFAASLPSPTNKSQTTPSSKQHPNTTKELFFKGTSSSKIFIENSSKTVHHGGGVDHVLRWSSSLSSSSLPQSSFIEWLENDKQSNPSLLASHNINEISKDIFDCIQPSVSWFGFDFVPVFVCHISRERRLKNEKELSKSTPSKLPFGVTPRGGNGKKRRRLDSSHIDSACCVDDQYDYKVQVEIKDSKTELKNNEQKVGRVTNLVKKIMEKCQFKGISTLTCRRLEKKHQNVQKSSHVGDEVEVWELSSDLTIELRIPLPVSKLIVLPPGFNTIGSRIVRSICNERGKLYLKEIRSQYLNWLLKSTDG